MLKVFSYLSSFSILLPLVLGIFKFKRFDEIIIKPFFWFILFTSLIEAVNFYLNLNALNNHLIFNLYAILFVIFILFVYKSEITRPFFIIGLTFSIPLFLLLLENSTIKDNTYIFTVSFTELILLSIYILYKVYKIKVDTIFGEPVFWISFGTLLYCSCTLIVFALSKYMINKNNPLLCSYYVYYLTSINIITNIFYAKSFLCLKLKEKY